MTRLLLLSCAMLLPLSANAQLAEANDRFDSDGSAYVLDGDEVTLSHSNSMEVVNGGVACWNSDGGWTSENNYWRIFDLSAEGLEGDLVISTILHGVATNTQDNEQSFFFYTVDGDFEWDNLELIDALFFTAETTDAGTVVALELDATVTIPSGSVLAVQVHIPHSNEEYAAFAGFNPDGQTAPTYIHSDDCDLPDPAPLGSLNPAWEDISWVMAVVGKDLVVSGEEGATARTVVLGDAYPNPMAGQATLPITLQEATHVRISIHDVLGREVAVVSDNMMQAGSQMINVSTDGFAAGTYIVRMVAGTEILSNRIVVVR